MAEIPYRQVDVFTATPFLGNPVAVFLGADKLTAAGMQRITNWMNLSECAFVLKSTRPGADYRVRIFDPKSEMPFAGHPTLGTAHAVLESGLVPRGAGELVQECEIGLVRLWIEEDGAIYFELPEPRIEATRREDTQVVASALRVAPSVFRSVQAVDVGPRWLTIELGSASEVLGLVPDMGALARATSGLGVGGVTVFGAHESGPAAIEVRSFAPGGGVPEDPVCGSGNGCVAAVLKRQGSRYGDRYAATQGSALGRDGTVQVRYVGESIRIGGHCVTCLSGTLLG